MTTGRYYDHYWSSGGYRPVGVFNEQLEAVYARHIRPGTRCLDLGCGDARTSAPWLTERGCRYVGVDVSASGLANARSRGLHVAQIGDGAWLPFRDGAFDHAVCVEVIEHVFSPLDVAAELRRVLAPGGTAIVTTPNIAYWRWRLDLLALGRWNPLGDDRSVEEPWRDPHIRFFTAPKLQEMFEAAGFEVLQVTGSQGAFLRDLPLVRGRVHSDAPSKLYRRFESRRPALLSVRLIAVVRRPA